MGVIRKQGIISSVLIYAAFVIGGLNTIILFPKFFTPEEFGLTTVFTNFATLFAAMATMGITNSYVKFYPLYKSHLKDEDNDLPAIALAICALGSILLVIGGILFKSFMVRKFSGHSHLFVRYYPWVLPMTVSFAFFMMAETFCWMIKKTVISNFTREIAFRLFTSILIVLYILKWISIHTFFILFSFIYVPGLLVLAGTLVKDGTVRLSFKLSHVTKRLYHKILTFTLFHFSGTIISILPRTVDSFIIASVSGLADAGIYTLASNIVAIMEVPQRSLNGISAATISEAWKNKDVGKINDIYQKSSLNLMILGFLIMGVVYPNMDNLVRFLPAYAMAKPIFLVMGMAKLVDLGTGANTFVLGYSRHWKVDFFTNVFMIFLTIPLNIYCIRHLGVIGAAVGNAVGLLLYNLLRCSYIWYFFKMQPFTRQTFYAVVIVLVSCILPLSMPYLGNIILDVIVRGGLFALVYVPAILYFKVSADFSELYSQFAQKIFRTK